MTLLADQIDLSTAPQTAKIDIDTLVKAKLPPLPSNLLRITSLLRNFNSSMRSLTESISYEPALVARILRLANSPLYSLERNITSVQNAIIVVGTKNVYDFVLVELASVSFNKLIHDQPLARQVWEHSIAVAVIARELGKLLEMRGTEEAFTCGLLHDIGKLILLSNNVEDYMAFLTENDESEMLEGETERFGYNHAEVGALVASRWKLPEEICSTILHHHHPAEATHAMIVAHIIDLADTIANIKGYGTRQASEEKLAAGASADKLRVTTETLERAWQNAEATIHEVIKTFT